jgi:hypothetical protein
LKLTNEQVVEHSVENLRLKEESEVDREFMVIKELNDKGNDLSFYREYRAIQLSSLEKIQQNTTTTILRRYFPITLGPITQGYKKGLRFTKSPGLMTASIALKSLRPVNLITLRNPHQQLLLKP